jgi:hypothetical protein
LQRARAAGQQAKEAKEFGRTEQLLDAASQRKAAADAARKAATEGLVGGIGNVVAGGARLAAGGM